MISTKKLIYKICQALGTMGDLETSATTLVGAINETHGRIHISTSTPTSADGNDGDVWFVYTE